jgi:23S rRNA (cytosine1962-C5)-methyltransferase
MALEHSCEITAKGQQWARTGHPWVYRDDLSTAGGGHGEVVRVTYKGRCLGSAFLSLRSKIALRWIERSEQPAIPDAAFWRGRLAAAFARRHEVALRTNAYRVVHDAADGIPGLVVDRYGPVAVVQSTIAGVEEMLPVLAEELGSLLGVDAVLARNDLAVREKEDLPREVRVLRGECPEVVWAHEDGPSGHIQFPASVKTGQKTGAFLDQRENRWRAAQLARGRLLDAFSYTGLFSLHAARRVAEAVAVDSSGPALDLCEKAAARGAITNLRTVQQNVFEYLKSAREAGERFQTIVLDPPAFAKNRGELPAALRGYHEINRRAMEILDAGGILVTCSCSYNLSEEEFVDVLRRAAAEAHAEFRVVERRAQAGDHPIHLAHPESAYLKCLVLERI